MYILPTSIAKKSRREADQILVRCWSRPANCGSLTWPTSIRPGFWVFGPVDPRWIKWKMCVCVWFGRVRKKCQNDEKHMGGLSAWFFGCFILQETSFSCITVSDIWLGGVALAGEWFWRCFWMHFVCSWPYASISMFHPTRNSNGFIYSDDRFQDVQRLFQTPKALLQSMSSTKALQPLRLDKVRKPAKPLGFRKVKVNLVVFVDG